MLYDEVQFFEGIDTVIIGLPVDNNDYKNNIYSLNEVLPVGAKITPIKYSADEKVEFVKDSKSRGVFCRAVKSSPVDLYQKYMRYSLVAMIEFNGIVAIATKHLRSHTLKIEFVGLNQYKLWSDIAKWKLLTEICNNDEGYRLLLHEIHVNYDYKHKHYDIFVEKLKVYSLYKESTAYMQKKNNRSRYKVTAYDRKVKDKRSSVLRVEIELRHMKMGFNSYDELQKHFDLLSQKARKKYLKTIK